MIYFNRPLCVNICVIIWMLLRFNIYIKKKYYIKGKIETPVITELKTINNNWIERYINVNNSYRLIQIKSVKSAQLVSKISSQLLFTCNNLHNMKSEIFYCLFNIFIHTHSVDDIFLIFTMSYFN